MTYSLVRIASAIAATVTLAAWVVQAIPVDNVKRCSPDEIFPKFYATDAAITYSPGWSFAGEGKAVQAYNNNPSAVSLPS